MKCLYEGCDYFIHTLYQKSTNSIAIGPAKEYRTTRGRLLHNQIKRLADLKTTRAPLHNLITRKTEKDVLFPKQKMLQLGNKSNGLLAQLAKNPPVKSFIPAILDENNQRQTNNHQINPILKEYYVNLNGLIFRDLNQFFS